MKGIRGTDRRKYILDLVRMSPRDANYKTEDNSGCLIRPELIVIFQRTKNLEYASQKIKEFEAETLSEAKKPEEEKKQTELNEKESRAKEAQDTLKRITVFQNALKEAVQFKFNINIFTNAKLVLTEEERKGTQIPRLP